MPTIFLQTRQSEQYFVVGREVGYSLIPNWFNSLLVDDIVTGNVTDREYLFFNSLKTF